MAFGVREGRSCRRENENTDTDGMDSHCALCRQLS
jgi:hypothetical protein